MAEILNSIIDRIGNIANAKSVFGEPVTAHGRTVIPVARIGCGFGGGGGRDNAERRGEGGGGGLMALPLGVYEISETGTRFIPLHDKRKLAGVALAAFCLGLLLRRGSNNG